MKFIVTVLGVAILVVLGVIVVTVIERTGDVVEPAPADEATRPPAFGEAAVALPADTEITDLIAEGDRLIVGLRGTDGTESLIVIDLATGRRLGLIELGREGR